MPWLKLYPKKQINLTQCRLHRPPKRQDHGSEGRTISRQTQAKSRDANGISWWACRTCSRSLFSTSRLFKSKQATLYSYSRSNKKGSFVWSFELIRVDAVQSGGQWLTGSRNFGIRELKSQADVCLLAMPSGSFTLLCANVGSGPSL
jgi:hypothetical protein